LWCRGARNDPRRRHHRSTSRAFLRSFYADHGLAGGGVELSAVAALHLALDLLKHVTPKLSQQGCWLVSTTRACLNPSN
jgi:hypothetical protein